MTLKTSGSPPPNPNTQGASFEKDTDNQNRNLLETLEPEEIDLRDV